METAPTAYIDQLPNEVLQIIFSIVYYDGGQYPPSSQRASDSRGWVHSILVL